MTNIPRLGLLRLAHVALRSPDPERLAAYYEANVGLVRVADAGDGAIRLTTDYQPHCLELHTASAPSLDHIAFEVESWEGFAREADLLAANGVPVAWGPGRHAPSRNYFMYFDDADGNRIEWMAGVRQIPDDETHEPAVFDPGQPTTWNVWGVMPPPHFLTRIGPGSLAAV